MNIIKVKLCKSSTLDAILKTIILFVSLVLMVLCVLYLKSECFDFRKEIIHSMRVAVRIIVIFIVMDYIRIKNKCNNE